jgi:hypothetical protein
MEEVREERERLSAQFGGGQTGLQDDEQPETSEEVKKGGIPGWKEKLKRDPYVREAKNIIVDMQR